MITNILVTGGCGFIGSHYVRFLLSSYSNIHVINADALTYSGNPHNLHDIEDDPRYTFLQVDLAKKEDVIKLFKQYTVDQVIHFAAESHVDRSIHGRDPFIHTNILGTFHLLEATLKKGIKKFIHISTDEVYGSIPVGKANELSPLQPGNPYSATKAASDLLCLSYFNTYQFPVTITRCTNNYGPNQHPEKMIPHSISLLLQDKPIQIYGDGQQERDWLHVLDHVRGIEEVRKHGSSGEIYNIGAQHPYPITNLEVARQLLEIMEKPSHFIQHVQDRKGHDVRYALDATKIQENLHWHPTISFEQGLQETVKWYLENTKWWLSTTQKMGDE